MKWMRSIILCCLLAAGAALSLAAQEKMLVIAPGLDHPLALVFKTAIGEALRSMGMEMDLQFFPPNRCAQMLDAGLAGGYLMGDASEPSLHPRLIKIDVSPASDEFVVFTKGKDLVVSDWSSLKPYSIGYMIGMVPVEKGLKSGGLSTATGTQSPQQAFQMLEANRVDLVIMPKIVGLAILKSLGISDIKSLPPALVKVPLYFFLDQSQKGIAEKLTQALKGMQDSGRIREITDQVTASLQ